MIKRVRGVVILDPNIDTLPQPASHLRQESEQGPSPEVYPHGVTERAEEALHGTHAGLEQRVQERTAELVKTNHALEAEIAERRRAEVRVAEMFRQLEKNRNDMLSILNQLDLGTAMTDRDGRLVFLSEVAQDLISKTPEEALGRHWAEVFPLSDEHCAQLKAMANQPPPSRMKVLARIESPTGRRYWVDFDVQDDPRDLQRITVQTNLLRVLEAREVTRVGESRPIKIDVRVIAATNQDLNQRIAQSAFRKDLLYRIRVARILLPPLRDRREDLPVLIDWFLGQVHTANSKSVQSVSNKALRILLDYAWPGNVRELRNVIEFAAIRCKKSIIQVEDLPPEIMHSLVRHLPAVGVEQDERKRLLAALDAANGNRTVAARLLGMSRATLYRRLASLGLETHKK